jgi:hypothetical protein
MRKVICVLRSCYGNTFLNMKQDVEEHTVIVFQFQLFASYYVPTLRVAWLIHMLCIP